MTGGEAQAPAPLAAGSGRRGQPPIGRRALLAPLAATLALAGCGFQLRRAPELQFRTIALTGFKLSSPLMEALRRQIEASATTRVIESANQAQVVLEALRDERERSVVASTAVGQVREIRLRSRLVFRLRTQAGREVIPPTELLLTRDMTFNETIALAKEQEENDLFRAMQNDIVAQVLRRLQALREV